MATKNFIPTQASLVRKYHYFSGVLLAGFIGVHLFNHLLIVVSEAAHIGFMQWARNVYRHPVVEAALFCVIVTQAVSGTVLVFRKRRHIKTTFDRLHVYSGVYLSYFMLVHTAAVWYGRTVLHLDTNLYFGAGVMASFPAMLVYIPYYSLAMLSFFVHVACIHRIKMEKYTSPGKARKQSLLISYTGLALTVIIVVKMALIKMPS